MAGQHQRSIKRHENGNDGYMIRASVSHTRNHLSALLGQVKVGETVLITDHGRPVAQLTRVDAISWSENIEALAKLGLVRLPTGKPLTLSEVRANRVDTGGNTRVLEALIEERAEGAVVLPLYP